MFQFLLYYCKNRAGDGAYTNDARNIFVNPKSQPSSIKLLPKNIILGFPVRDAKFYGFFIKVHSILLRISSKENSPFYTDSDMTTLNLVLSYLVWREPSNLLDLLNVYLTKEFALILALRRDKSVLDIVKGTMMVSDLIATITVVA